MEEDSRWAGRCSTCRMMNGEVAFSSVWLGFHSGQRPCVVVADESAMKLVENRDERTPLKGWMYVVLAARGCLFKRQLIAYRDYRTYRLNVPR